MDAQLAVSEQDPESIRWTEYQTSDNVRLSERSYHIMSLDTYLGNATLFPEPYDIDHPSWTRFAHR
jgi:hypothetical protein